MYTDAFDINIQISLLRRQLRGLRPEKITGSLLSIFFCPHKNVARPPQASTGCASLAKPSEMPVVEAIFKYVFNHRF